MAKSLTSKSLAKLLNAFSTDEAAAALAYTKLRDALVRYFQVKGVSDPFEAADATIDRVADKVEENTSIEDLTKFSFGVAKFIFFERARIAKSQMRAADGFYLKTGFVENPLDRDHLDPLRECFLSLSKDDKKLLSMYFADMSADEIFLFRQKTADYHNISLNTLRIRVSRLRKRLEDCVNSMLKK